MLTTCSFEHSLTHLSLSRNGYAFLVPSAQLMQLSPFQYGLLESAVTHAEQTAFFVVHSVAVSVLPLSSSRTSVS